MFTATNPTTGEVIHQYPTHTSEAVSTAIEDSQAAFQVWRKTPFAERAALLNKVADLMAEDEERLARLMTVEMGKPIREAYGEVQKAAWCARHYAEQAEGYLAPQELASDASLSYVQHLPLGPLLGILPWNAPFWLAFRFCAPALMAGNTCLMKHDSHVPACAEAIGELFVKAGAPKGLMQNLRLHNDQVAQVITQPAVRSRLWPPNTSNRRCWSWGVPTRVWCWRTPILKKPRKCWRCHALSMPDNPASPPNESSSKRRSMKRLSTPFISISPN
jgi:succinate-semialdehyde dehydrogenase/glutarate-semialdehyde dehydrogenase